MKTTPRRWWIIGVAAAISAAGIATWLRSGKEAGTDVATFAVQKGTLQINVLQGGEIRALSNFEVKSEIETATKILSLIPEGYLITEEDVKDGKVLVELDSSDIKDRISTHDIEFQTTVSLYIDADENREIIRSENQSLVRETKNAALFALMDFEKYLGKDASTRILKVRGLPETMDAFDKQIASLEAAADAPVRRLQTDIKTDGKVVAAAKDKIVPKRTQGEFRTDYMSVLDAKLGGDGDAQQKLRQLSDELLLHKSEQGLAKQTVEASERLAAKDFITKTALENDQVSLEKIDLSVKTADTQLDLYRKYEYPKQAELFISAYQESLHKLQRTIRANRSKSAQAESKFETAKRRYDMELNKKEELEHQLKACVIKASVTGLVAYGPINSVSNFREPIEEGAAVRLRQTILTIPDMTKMGVHVAVHESQVKKVKIGKPAVVRVDAEPGKQLFGTVAELAVLPDSTSSRYTPNLKVYPCSIHIDGAFDWLKPGMNAKVEIIISQLDDVMYVPIQAIEVEQDHHFCYVNEGGELVRREVKTGGFNDEFIEVQGGLKTGELVALAIPKRSTLDGPVDVVAPKPGAAPKTPAKKEKGLAKS